MVERMRGMVGRRKRGSWWGIRERMAVPVRAEREGRVDKRGRARKRRRAGPRRRGREARKCW